MTRSSYRSLLLYTFISMDASIYAADLYQASIGDCRPAEHLFPITQEVIKGPVVVSDGFFYERAAILEWINAHHTSPMTRAVMVNNVHPNQNLRNVISEWKPGAIGKRSVMADISPDEVIKVLREEFARNETLLAPEYAARDKDIVVFLGNTGAGKSTLINFLAGKELRTIGQRYALVNASDPRAMPIGTQLFNSETLYPKSIDIPDIENATLRFFDLPGLNDTDGSVQNLVKAALVRQILLDAKTVRFVYVAGEDQLIADRGKSVQDTINALSQLFVTETDPSSPLDGGLFVVSKESGLLNDIANGTDANLPIQIQLWKAKGHIVRMHHSRLNEQNTPQHRKDLLERIEKLVPQKLISINVGDLYPAETPRDIDRMYERMYESAYQKAKADQGQTLSELESTLALWQRKTFWDEFEAKYVYLLYPSITVLKDLTIQSYSKVRNKFIEEQAVNRKKNIKRVQRLLENKVNTIEQETILRADSVITRIRAEQGQFGVVPPYDFGNHRVYWDAVCSPAVLGKITGDAKEQEVMRKVYSQWVGEHYERQVANNPVMLELQRKMEVLLRYVGIPDIVRGNEEIYGQFLRWKLVHKPNKNNDEGRREFKIGDLANPLSGTFDLSGCGDSAKYLSISTGFRTSVNPENKEKVEVWIVPQFVLQNDTRAKAFNDFLQIQEKHRDKPFAILFNWGGWNDLEWHEVAGVSDNIFDNICDIWRRATTATTALSFITGHDDDAAYATHLSEQTWKFFTAMSE